MGQIEEEKATLMELFHRLNLDELPAISAHVQELVSLTNSQRSTANDLTISILKDYSLTNKILQVANSAYYARGLPIGSISRAVTVIGFAAIREIALTTALLEDFVKSASDRERISKLLTQSFLSAMQVKILCQQRELGEAAEDAFICGLLHYLGKIIVLIYMPELYTEIETRIAGGFSEESAAKGILDNLSFQQVGEVIARHWRFSEEILLAMPSFPDPPLNPQDSKGYIRNAVVFFNKLTVALGLHQELLVRKVMNYYCPLLGLHGPEVAALFSQSVEASADTSETIRFGLQKLGIQKELAGIERLLGRFQR